MNRDDYEAALTALEDSLDMRLKFESGGVLRSAFATPYTVTLSECATPKQIMRHATELLFTLLDDPTASPDYLIHRFVRLTKEFHKLNYDFEPFCRRLEITQVWGQIQPEYINISNGSHKSSLLKLAGLHIEREAGNAWRCVKITQPLYGYQDNTLHAFVESADIVLTKNYMLFSISPATKWISSYEGEVHPSVKDRFRISRFLIRFDTFNEEIPLILSALQFLFRGLKLTVNPRQSGEGLTQMRPTHSAPIHSRPTLNLFASKFKCIVCRKKNTVTGPPLS